MFIIVCPIVRAGMPSFKMGRSVVVLVQIAWLPPELAYTQDDIYIALPLPVLEDTRHALLLCELYYSFTILYVAVIANKDHITYP